jgi:hypothetical protein
LHQLLVIVLAIGEAEGFSHGFYGFIERDHVRAAPVDQRGEAGGCDPNKLTTNVRNIIDISIISIIDEPLRIEKLQKLGMSVPEANELMRSAPQAKFRQQHSKGASRR